MCLSLLFTVNVFSAERVLISDSKMTNVTLDRSSVRCTPIGYSVPELKINIKGLDGWTLFDHSNIFAGDLNGEPCMTAGECSFVRDPIVSDLFTIDDILAGGSRVEKIQVNRQIVEMKNISQDNLGNDACFRSIEERLQADVKRGDGKGFIHFTHKRFGLAEQFPLSVCQR